jgi:CheY-like chemotaxis protein
MGFDSNRLITIDTISVDGHSRLTLTRKLKKVLPVIPKDTITVYQDRYNNDLIFAIQHESTNTTDSFIVKTTTNNNNAFHHTKKIEKNQQEVSISNQYVKKKDTLHDINILIVDDEEYILKTFESFLIFEGYHNVRIFSDPKKVITHFVQLKTIDYYQLAILDIRMPVINGIQLYQILRIMNPNLKVLFVTALDAAAELTSMFNIKEVDIIKKPCSLDQFIKKINDVVLKVFGYKEKV